MKLDKILVYINFVANKRQRGSQLVPEQYNAQLEAFNDELFEEEWNAVKLQAKQLQVPLYDAILSSSAMHLFKKEHTFAATTSTGEVTNPADFEYLFSMKAKYKGMMRDIKESSNEEMTNILGSLVDTILEQNPRAVRLAVGYKIYPYDVGKAPDFVTMTYLRKPATPFFDWCIDNSRGIAVYMPVGSNIHLNDGLIPCLYVGGVEKLQNVSHPSYNNVGTYNSLSVELEWPARVHHKIYNRILAAMGITMGDKVLADYGQGEAKQ